MEQQKGKRRLFGLAAKFTVPFVLTIAVSLVAVGAILLFISREGLLQEVLRGQRKSAETVALNISSYIEGTRDSLRLFAVDSGPTIDLDFEAQQEALRSLQELRSDAIREMTLLDMQGNELCRYSPFVTFVETSMRNRSDSEAFQVASGGEEYVADDAKIPEYSILRIITMAVPVYGAEGRQIGVLTADVGIEAVWEAISAAQIGESGYAYVIDRNGSLLGHSDVERYYYFRGQAIAEEVSVIALVIQGTDEQPVDTYAGLESLSEGEEVDVIGAYAQVTGINWFAIVELPTEEALTNVQRLGVSIAVLLVIATIVASILGALVPRPMLAAFQRLREGAEVLGSGRLDYTVQMKTNDELEDLANSFNIMAERLRGLYTGLEERVAERTQELAQRSAYLEAAAEVGRASGSILDPDRLIEQVVELVQRRFGLYYVGLFMVDVAGEWAVLRAGTGEAGQAMLARGHRIRIGQGMVGWSVASGQARIALEVGDDVVRLATSELPETRSEAAIPLRSRGHILGAMTVQSSDPEAFDQDTITVLQTMADQIAVAIDNARLFADSQAALDAERRAYGEISRAAWQSLVSARAGLGYRYENREIRVARGDWHPTMAAAVESAQSVQGDDPEDRTLAIPIKVRDQVIGALRFRKDGEGGVWSGDDVDLLQNLADQLGVALEGARLYQDSQRLAAREQLTGEITTRIRASLDVETVLQTAVQEISQTLGLLALDVRLDTDVDDAGK